MQKHVFIGGKSENSRGTCLMTKIYISGNCMFFWHHMDWAFLWNKFMACHLHSCLHFRDRPFIFLVSVHVNNLWFSPQWQAERGASRGMRQHTVSQWVNPSAGSHSRVPVSYFLYSNKKTTWYCMWWIFQTMWFLKKQVLKNSFQFESLHRGPRKDKAERDAEALSEHIFEEVTDMGNLGVQRCSSQ